MNRRHLLKSLAAVGAAGAGTLSHAQPAAGPAVRITLPSAGSAGSVWRPLIDKLKLIAGTGLNLEWLSADPGKMQTQLAAGALDIGVFGAVGLATLVNRGSDIVLFGPALNNHGRWIVRADSNYRTLQDLVGKTIATTAETSETYQQARIAASLNGVDLKKDVKVIHGSPTANLALFERGDVDAIITLEPTATRLVGRGARELARVADQWKKATGRTDDPFLVGLAASQKWLDANKDTAAKVAAVFERLGQHIRKEPALLQGVTHEMGLKADETQAASLLPQRAAPSYASQWDGGVFAVIDKQIEVAVQLGLLDKAPSRKIYTKV